MVIFNFDKKLGLFFKFNRQRGQNGTAIYLAVLVLMVVMTVALGVSIIFNIPVERIE
jgi:hypothetical protein